MRTSLTSFFIGVCVVSSAGPTYGQGKFSLSVIGSPNFHYIDSQLTESLPDGSGAIRPRELYVKQKGAGYSAGVMANYWFSEKWSVATGILLNSVDYQEPTVSINPGGVQFLTIASTARSFQVPLTIHYRTSMKRLSPYLSAGALTNIHSVRIFEGSSKGRNIVDKLRLHPALGVGIDYRLNDHFSMIVQPTFVYYLPYRETISYTNYQLGLQVQAHYRF